MNRSSRIALCALGGLAAGAGLAGFKFPGYLHASVALNGPEKTLSIDGERRQFLALSVTGLQATRELEVRMHGARIGSWFPPAVRLPYGDTPVFSAGKFSGFGPDRKLPVYVGFDSGRCSAIDFVDAASGKLLRTVKIVRGGADAGHQH